MTYSKDVGASITLNEAKDWTKNYRTANPDSVKAHFIGANIINDILEQEGCVGFRVYHAIDDNNKKEIVFVGVDSSGKDMVNGIIADRTWPCPNSCDTNSPLY